MLVTYKGLLYIRGDLAPFGTDCFSEDEYTYHTADHQSQLWVNGDHQTPKEMGWKPRQWPKSFVDEVTDVDYFRIARIEHNQGPNWVSPGPTPLAGYKYITEHGDLMKVYNDKGDN